MNRLMFSLTLFIVSTILITAQPKFVIVGGDEYNWGDVKSQNSPAKGSATFKNEGNEDLVIKKVQPNCGCTAAKPEKDTLKPGETTAMNFELNLGANTGVLSKSIRIETNDPNRANVSYRIKANVIRDIICKPSNIMNFRGIKIGQEASQKTYIKNNTDKPIRFSDLKVEPPIIKLTIPSSFTIEPGKEVELIGSITPQEVGNKHARISFNTDHKDNPRFDITVYVQVEPLTPATLPAKLPEKQKSNN